MTRYARPLTVTFLSASTLAYEILLVRVFAIEQFHHFAYMAIGIAMLGFGASGTLVALARPQQESAARWFAWAAVLTPVALVASATLVHQVPLDATQLPWDVGQWPRLALVYLLLALPFAVAALAVLLALTLEPERTGWIYGASFLGAGLGAALAVAVLWIVFPVRALAVPALVASLGGMSAVPVAATRKTPLKGCAWGTLLLGAAVFVEPLWRLDITPYKGLPQVEAFPDARRVAERASPLGWVVAVDASAFRHAPGLSLTYTGAFPRQTALFVDAEIAGAVSDWSAEAAARAILDWLPSALPYALGERREVLVIGAGGGLEVWNALAHGAHRVKALELNPELVRLGGWSDSTVVGSPQAVEVEWAIGDARGHVAGSRERFDLITMGGGRAYGTSAAGVHALNEDFLHTQEAYVSYVERLSDEGVLAITRWLTVPPRENVRVILTAVEALRRHAPDAVAHGLVVARSWATGTVLMKPSGFSSQDVERLAAWAEARRFDLDWYPGIDVPATRFNIMDEPVLYRAAAAAVAGSDSAERFAAAYAFDVTVADDARPYPHHFLRVGSLRSFLAGSRGSWLPFAEWGYIALLATLVQSVVLAGLLMLVPAALRARGAGSAGWLRLVGYFTAIGLAYLAAEVAAIQQLNLLLGHPVYAVAAVLTAFLICSGAGSAWSDRQPATRGWIVGAVLVGMLMLCAAQLLALIHLLQPTPLPLRVAVAVAVLAPLAFLMGTPFPLGLRFLASMDTGAVAWAWAANGFSSVVATPLAALIALEAGSQVLFLAAAAAYACAALLHGGFSRLGSPGV
ncbi:MAG: SAM-dependent methyltransferase [Gemmatimonadota bacterium]|nr:MAG: SAM-dependent methyltransferase [Gemmatimonadota bacterium]